MVATPSKRMNLGSRDLFSGLPDCLISQILSFVPSKEAASTSVLAKRWRYLFAYTPNLDFDDSIYLIPKVCNEKKTAFPVAKQKKRIPTSFVDFVDRVLVLHQYVPLKRFSLKCEDIVHPAIVIGWILKVIGRGVIDLDIDLPTEWYCSLPSEIFVCETLVRLKMVIGDVLVINVKDIFLPNVKTLYLDCVKIKDSVFTKLLSGCLALEELVLNNLLECRVSWYVSSETLKRLTIYRSRKFDETHESVSFDTPNLLYLVYSDTIANKYPKVKFDSLVEASLDLRMTTHQIITAKFSNDDGSHPEEMVGNATDFVMGICHVKILYLSHRTLEVLTYCCKSIPEFNNLIHLTIKTDSDVSWESLPALLKNCPKLETLVFKRLHHKFINCAEEDGCLCNLRDDIPTCLSLSPVKVLKVLKFGENDLEGQIKQVQHFLETMPNLEQLILYYETYFDEEVDELSSQLQKHPRVSSSKCKIQVISVNLSLSSIVPSPVTTKWGRLM